MMDNLEVVLEIEQKIKNKIIGVVEFVEEDDVGVKGKSIKNVVKVSEDQNVFEEGICRIIM